MAFKSNAAAAEDNGNTPANDKWKAVSFLNISLPADTSTGQRKFGSISLRLSNENEKELHEWLVTDPAKTASRLAKVVSQFIVTFNTNERKPGTGFKLED